MMKNFYSAFILLFACQAVSTTAQVIEKTSPGRWKNHAYQWFYNPQDKPIWLSDSEAKTLMLEAASRWEQCGIRMQYLGDAKEIPGQMDGKNVVGWSMSIDRKLRGLTTGRAIAGDLMERDIAIRPDRLEFRQSQHLLEKVVTHEFGHAIGLTHSARCDDVMTLAASCAKTDPEQLPILPTEHDLDRCKYLYGAIQK